MEMFKLNLDLELVSYGDINIEKSLTELRLISKCGNKKYEKGEEAISQTLFIISRSEKDFLRVECHSIDEVHFSSDRICYEGGWFKRIFSDSLIQFRSTTENAEQVIKEYFNLSREDFESKYSVGYTNQRSLQYVKI